MFNIVSSLTLSTIQSKRIELNLKIDELMSCQIKPVALVAVSEAPEQLKKVAAEMSYFVSHSKVLL